MKPNNILLAPALLVAASLASAGMVFAQTQIITFDDLPNPDGGSFNKYTGTIPNGYSGLQWSSFWYVDGVNYQPNPSGYLYGVVSPNYAAFNGYANPATISGATFNLNSAYLTGAWNDGLQVEVQGFVGATLTYDNTYTVNSTGPTLINFNYLGIDEVKFSSSGGTGNPAFVSGGEQFVMDNLNITITPEPSTFRLLWLAVMMLICCRRAAKSKYYLHGFPCVWSEASEEALKPVGIRVHPC